MRNLPRTSASPAFTREVMRNVGRASARPRPMFWRLAAAFAMAAVVALLVNVAVLQHREQQRTLALRAEQQQLEAELEAVKKIARETEPMVVLENDRGTRVIMDLDTAIQPASLRNYD
jgi:anti-sigma-K factor RskA